MQARAGDITRLLAGWREGDRSALNRLVPLVRAELDGLARRHPGREQPHPSRCSLPLWCRKHFSGFCLAPKSRGRTGLISSPSPHK